MRRYDSFLNWSCAPYARIEAVRCHHQYVTLKKKPRKVVGVLTQPCDRGTEVAEYGRTGVAHLTLDRQLRLHVDLSAPASHKGDDETGDGEQRREGHDREELHDHGYSQLDDPAERVRELSVDCKFCSARTATGIRTRDKKHTHCTGCPACTA